MYRLHFHRNLRSLVFVFITLLVMSLPLALWWANRTGLPEAWRTVIEREMDRQGMHLRVGGLSYIPLQGLVATEVVFYDSEDRLREISRVERVVMGFDRTKLARGRFEITRLRLRNADLVMPVEDGNPESEMLEIRGLNGTLLLPGARRYELKQTTGMVEGVEVEIHARIIGRAPGENEPTEEKKNNENTRRRVVADVVSEIAKWKFDESSPPRLRVWIEGDLNEPSSIHSRVVLESERVEKNNIALESLVCEGEARAGVITFNRIHARDGRGELDCRLDYDSAAKKGRFEGESSLDILPLLDGWFGIRRVDPILLGGTQHITAQGSFRKTEAGTLAVEAMGRVSCGSVMLKGVLFDEVSGGFSWRDGSLFMRDLQLKRPDGTATAKLLVEWPLVRLALKSDLPAAVGKPFFAGQPLERVLNDFTAREGAECHVDIEGGFNATDRYSWAYSGKAALKNMDYRGVPLSSVSCDMSLNRNELDFTNGRIQFDYWKYPMRIAHNGPQEAVAHVGRVRYRREDRLVDVEGVKGDFWPAPMVRLFAAKTADTIEAYRFHSPPALEGSGVVDVTPEGRTSLVVDFRSATAATTELLGKDLVLGKPEGRVTIRGKQVDVTGLKCAVFDGPMNATITVSDGGRIAAEMNWTKLELPRIADTYGFAVKGGGKLTGRIQFDMRRGRVETMGGDGLLALEDTELFSVPMFGPLSHVISGVLGDKRAGFERAKSAFCNFTIRDGVMETRDFTTSTRSLNFAGDGMVDLTNQTIDMTMRMNARGLLGFLTIPLRPFYGMFQFRGTGPIKSPEWRNVMFTTPPKEQEEALKNPPKAQVVEP